MSRQTNIGKLPEVSVRNAKGRVKPYKLSDGGGLYLLVNPNSSKYWRLKYKLHGKEKVLALGVYPAVSMSEARVGAVKAKEQLRQGIDPVIRRRQEKHINASNIFRIIAEEWFNQQKDIWTESHANRVWRTLELDVLPMIGDIPINEIKTLDCLAVIRSVEGRGALDVASRVKQRISSVFRYAIQTARCEFNPADQLQGVIRTRKVEHRKYLPAEALPAYFKKVETYDGTLVVKLALQLLPYVFLRSSEYREGMWQEIDFDKREWRVPGERMKMKDEHIVPLSEQAISILEELKGITGKFELLFPSSRNARKPISENTINIAIKKRLGFAATSDGFRSTASTILNEKGFRLDVIERQLAHVERNKVRAAYNRSQYLAERREMMEWWGNYLKERTSN